MDVEDLSAEELAVLAALRAGDAAAADRLAALGEASRQRVLAALADPGGSPPALAVPSAAGDVGPAATGGVSPGRRPGIVVVAVAVLAVAGVGAWLLVNQFSGGDTPDTGGGVAAPQPEPPPPAEPAAQRDSAPEPPSPAEPAAQRDSAPEPVSEPVDALAPQAPPVGFTVISAGRWHSCGLRADATVTCWGNNAWGQIDVSAGSFSAVAAGERHSCGLRVDATVTCWGRNDDGQTDAPAGSFSAVAAGWGHSCGLRLDATVTCWGNNAWGQADAPAGSFSAVAAGDLHSCGLRPDATVTCWNWLTNLPEDVRWLW